jgi:hypothetical protein
MASDNSKLPKTFVTFSDLVAASGLSEDEMLHRLYGILAKRAEDQTPKPESVPESQSPARIWPTPGQLARAAGSPDVWVNVQKTAAAMAEAWTAFQALTERTFGIDTGGPDSEGGPVVRWSDVEEVERLRAVMLAAMRGGLQ